MHVNPLLHRYAFLRLLQQTTFENIVTKEMFSKLSNLKMYISFSRVNIQDFSKCRRKVAVWGKGLKEKIFFYEL